MLALIENLEFFRKLRRTLINSIGELSKAVNSIDNNAAVRIGCKNLAEGIGFCLEHFSHSVKADKTGNG